MMLLTVKDAAQRARVSSSLVYEWLASGVLPCYRFGREGKRGCIRIDPDELDAFLARCKREKATAAPLPLKHITLP
jgi:excisionase family DNA binding protein